MKDCENIALELPGYVSGKLDSREAAPVRVHLQSCRTCQAEAGQLQRLETLLGRHLPVIEPSRTFASAFANRLAAEIAAEEQKAEQGRGGVFGWLFRPWLIPVAAAAALGALLMTPWLSQPPVVAVAPIAKPPVAIAKKPKPETKAVAAAPEKATDKSVAVASNPPDDLVQRPQLFVDFAVIRDLDLLEDGTG